MVASEPELVWRKSSYSKPAGNCVELAELPDGGVAMRDSKNPLGSVLRFTATEWSAFAHGWATGEFNDLMGR